MKVIISPAKSINPVQLPQTDQYSIAKFLKETDVLVKKLKKLSSKKIAEMMHLSEDLAELNFNRYQNWVEPTGLADAIFPAISGFNGEVYKGIDAHSLSEDELKRLQETVYILSGIYGVLKPLDLIHPYRLEMGTKWQITPKTKNLYQFWGTKLTDFVNEEMSSDEVLINLASSEYFKALPFNKLNSKVITPHFKDFKNGTLKIVMMYAKHQRGAMARYIVQNNIQNPEDLKLYNLDGYSFDVNNSTDTDWVFIR
jgi:uncharacterized protein